MVDNLLKPTWLEGPTIPHSLVMDGGYNTDHLEVEGDSKLEVSMD